MDAVVARNIAHYSHVQNRDRHGELLVTHQHLEYIDLMQEMNLDVAGEFLVMAATLIHIKSKMLLPRPEKALDEIAADVIAAHANAGSDRGDQIGLGPEVVVQGGVVDARGRGKLAGQTAAVGAESHAPHRTGVTSYGGSQLLEPLSAAPEALPRAIGRARDGPDSD